MRERRNEYGIFVGKPGRKGPLGRPRLRWVSNIKMDLEEIKWDDTNWIHLTQDRDYWRVLVNKAMNLRVLSSCTTGGFSRTQLTISE
jgi:hypothetical protein